MTTAHTAVVVMAYGTPRSREDILPYYTDIRRGRAPTPELLKELEDRYEAIGGLSPLAQITDAQANTWSWDSSMQNHSSRTQYMKLHASELKKSSA